MSLIEVRREEQRTYSRTQWMPKFADLKESYIATITAVMQEDFPGREFDVIKEDDKSCYGWLKEKNHNMCYLSYKRTY